MLASSKVCDKVVVWDAALDQDFRTGHFDLAIGELIALVEAEACPVRLAALFHQWRNRYQQLVSWCSFAY